MTKSREEAIAAGIKVSDTRHSMNRRKSWHDYRRQGTYMLTFVVEGRQPLLGKLLMNEGQLDTWKHYLDDNPRRLSVKRLHPDYFTIMQHITIGEWQCQMVGNRFLLDIPQKVAVIVHRAFSDEEYASRRKQWLACGEAGGVLVSAAIATREKSVMREAMDLGYHIIWVRENGFPPLYKPSGESFDACSQGRLLQVCPWEYHMGKRTISREQCLKLNRLVEEIADE